MKCFECDKEACAQTCYLYAGEESYLYYCKEHWQETLREKNHGYNTLPKEKIGAKK